MSVYIVSGLNGSMMRANPVQVFVQVSEKYSGCDHFQLLFHAQRVDYEFFMLELIMMKKMRWKWMCWKKNTIIIIFVIMVKKRRWKKMLKLCLGKNDIDCFRVLCNVCQLPKEPFEPVLEGDEMWVKLGVNPKKTMIGRPCRKAAVYCCQREVSMTQNTREM